MRPDRTLPDDRRARRTKEVALLLAAAVVLAVPGCGKQECAAPSLDVTGTWVGRIDSTDGPPGYTPNFSYTMTLVLTQTGADVAGTLSSDIGYKGTAAGAVCGDRLHAKLSREPCGFGGQPGVFDLTGVIAKTGTATTIQVDYMGDACDAYVYDYGKGTLVKQ